MLQLSQPPRRLFPPYSFISAALLFFNIEARDCHTALGAGRLQPFTRQGLDTSFPPPRRRIQVTMLSTPVASIRPHVPIEHLPCQVAEGWMDISCGPHLVHDLQLGDQSQPAPEELLLRTTADMQRSLARFVGVGRDCLLLWRCFQLFVPSRNTQGGTEPFYKGQ